MTVSSIQSLPFTSGVRLEGPKDMVPQHDVLAIITLGEPVVDVVVFDLVDGRENRALEVKAGVVEGGQETPEDHKG